MLLFVYLVLVVFGCCFCLICLEFWWIVILLFCCWLLLLVTVAGVDLIILYFEFGV